jgi:hypothetical protein
MTCVMNTPDLPRYIHDALHYNANITLMVILQFSTNDSEKIIYPARYQRHASLKNTTPATWP